MRNALFLFSSRRRHTRWTGDWSSDVCSSDLDGGDLPRPQRADGREDEDGAESRNRDLCDQPREYGQDDQHPYAGPDRRPPGFAADGHIQRGTPDRASHPDATEETRGQVASALRDDVLVRVRLRSAWVGYGFGDPGALDEDDDGHRQRAGDQAE